ncbi:MAG: lauroyl acyltransferase [Mariprofundaceae bacterium]
MDSLLTVSVKTLFLLLRCLPVRLAGMCGAGLGRLAWFIDRKHQKIALRNLARIYPEREQHWRNRISRESFAELGRSLFELPHVFLRSKAFLRSRIEVEGEDALRAAMDRNKGAFIAACHHSNWELGGLALSMLDYPTSIIYRPLNQQGADHFFQKCRKRFGAQLHRRSSNLRWLPKSLKKGDLIAIMVDQHISEGVPIPFLGHLANSTTLPAPFVYKYNTPVFTVSLERIKHSFRFRLCFREVNVPASCGHKERDAFQLMHEIHQCFTPIIDQRPECWLWIHCRWRVLEQSKTIAEVVHGTT